MIFRRRKIVLLGLALALTAGLLATSMPTAGAAGTTNATAAWRARQVLGADYEYGGTNPRTVGVDCSGLVIWAWGGLGYQFPGRTAEQIYMNMPRYLLFHSDGSRRIDLRQGDLIFWDFEAGGKNPDHMAIYDGDGYIIHASSSKDSVVRVKMSTLGTASIKRYFVRP